MIDRSEQAIRLHAAISSMSFPRARYADSVASELARDHVAEFGTCPACEGRIRPPRRLFCSRECQVRFHNFHRGGDKMTRTCDYCGAEFPARRDSARFCSDRCRVYAARKRTETATSERRTAGATSDTSGDGKAERGRYAAHSAARYLDGTEKVDVSGGCSGPLRTIRGDRTTEGEP